MKNSIGPTIELSFKASGVQTRVAFEPGTIKVGRVPGCDLVIDDKLMSREHGTISFEEGQWTVRDNRSANGTKVNGKRIREQNLSDGDTIRFARVDVNCRIQDRTRALDDFDQDSGELDGLMTQSIVVGDFDELVRNALQTDPESSPVDRSKPDSVKLRPDREATADPLQAAAWILSMVKGTTDALVSVDELDQVLERVLGLVFDNIPVDYGVIYLCQGNLDELEKKSERSSPSSGGKTIQLSRSIARMACEGREAVLVKDAALDDRLIGMESIVSAGIRSAMCAPLVHRSSVVGLIYVAQLTDREAYSPTQLETLSILAGLSAAAVESARLREGIAQEKEIRVRLSRYHAPAVVERIISAGCEECEEMTSEECQISVLFCDLVGFTSLSENMAAKEVTRILNLLFQGVTDIIFSESGTLDKFIGDAAMAFFGAPVWYPDHAERAVRAGLKIQEALRKFNQSGHSPVPLAVRVGINSGNAIVGDVGARERKDYTCIGDTVNVASRLEGYVAQRGQVVIGPKTFELLKGCIPTRPLEKVLLRNRKVETQPYLVLDPEAAE